MPFTLTEIDAEKAFPRCTQEYVQWTREALQQAHAFARERLQAAAERQKRNYDRRVDRRVVQPGDWVWYRYPPDLRRKLKFNWSGPYLVVGTGTGSTVTIQESPEATSKTVHRDHMKPLVGDGPCEPWVIPPPQQATEDSSDPAPTAEALSDSDVADKMEKETPTPCSTTVSDRPRRETRRPVRLIETCTVTVASIIVRPSPRHGADAIVSVAWLRSSRATF